jgi:monogalactosyldiacylglycerol (MGDG) synthase/glycosyl transferase family 28
MPKIGLVYFDAGGGHRSAANALRLVIDQQQPWQVDLINLQQLLEPIDLLHKLTGLRTEDLYNLMLKKNWTLGMAHLLPFLQALIRFYHDDMATLVEQRLRENGPDILVSLIPHFNRVLRESFDRVNPSAGFVTILTDLADYPPHFWIERQEQHFVCGSDRAMEQARAAGVDEHYVHRVSGMILHPRFYQPLLLDRSLERESLSLDPYLPTGLVMFGGQGSSSMAEIAERLDVSTLDLQLIFICGRNERLKRQLAQGHSRLRRLVIGYTSDVPTYMSLSDFFIGKPGPGSLSEALHMKLPVIVERNARTMPQERYNAEWVLERRVGIAVSGFRNIDSAVEQLLHPVNFARFRTNAAALENRAVFEIVDILQRILQGKHSEMTDQALKGATDSVTLSSCSPPLKS